MSNQEKIVIIIEESVTKSLIKDAGTFALFAGLLWFNHAILSGNTLIDVLFIVLILMFMIGRKSNQLYKGNVSGAISYLKDKL